MGAQQRRFEQFRCEYNEHRPHEALGQDTPAQHYVPSSREYPTRLPAAREFPDDWQKRRVRPGGRMKWKGREVNITRALEEQYVGLEPVGDGQWAVWFQDLELGMFDERKMKVQAHKSIRTRA